MGSRFVTSTRSKCRLGVGSCQRAPGDGSMAAMSMEHRPQAAEPVHGGETREVLSRPLRPRSGDKVKVAVLGAGSLGKEHVRIYAELAAAGGGEFAGVYDTVAETAQRFAQKYQVCAFGSVAEAAAASDAVSIVTPTTTHFELAKTLLQQGRRTESTRKTGESINHTVAVARTERLYKLRPSEEASPPVYAYLNNTAGQIDNLFEQLIMS